MFERKERYSMSTKNIYLFKVVIRDTQTNTEVPVRSFKVLFQDVFDRENPTAAQSGKTAGGQGSHI